MFMVVMVGLLLAGCGAGASTLHRRPAHIEVFVGNSRVLLHRRFVARTVDGVRFLVPAQLDLAATDFIHPNLVNAVPFPSSAPGARMPTFYPITRAGINRPYHVEIVATGPAGLPVDISWTESCGTAGGAGLKRGRLPTVVAVKLPNWSTGGDICGLGVIMSSMVHSRGASVEVVNY